jgi:hypothetical protein
MNQTPETYSGMYLSLMEEYPGQPVYLTHPNLQNIEGLQQTVCVQIVTKWLHTVKDETMEKMRTSRETARQIRFAASVAVVRGLNGKFKPIFDVLDGIK